MKPMPNDVINVGYWWFCDVRSYNGYHFRMSIGSLEWFPKCINVECMSVMTICEFPEVTKMNSNPMQI